MIFVFVASSFLILVNADQRCPFPSCSRNYSYSTGGCDIYCYGKMFPDAGVLNVVKIDNFYLYNLENIPKNAFQGLQINSLTIDWRNLFQVEEGAFDNVESLNRLNLYGRYENVSSFFEKNITEPLFNITSHLSISTAGLNNQSLVEILDKLQPWTRLNTLDISNNFFQHFSYDFSNFTQLRQLSLTGNSIETIDIIGNQLTSLYLDSNKIAMLEKEMFMYLPNLITLSIDNNNIGKISNDSFVSTKKLQSIYLENNKINSIEPNSFCELSFNKYSSRVVLSNNNLSDTTLYCLENIAYLSLDAVQFSGEIDQKRLGNAKNVLSLSLNSNRINKISFENMTNLKYLYLHSNELVNFTWQAVQAFPNLNTLNINSNRFTEKSLECFNQLKILTTLYIRNNLLTRIESNHFIENKNLNYIDMDWNQIETVSFSNLINLKFLYLNNNKLKQIDKESFSQLTNLENLRLSSNLIAKIHPKAFYSNGYLSILSLSNNHLTTTPDISILKQLNFLDLNRNKINSLANHAFERRLDEANPLRSNIEIDLRGNDIKLYTSKTFCSQHASSLGFLGFELLVNDINQMDRCMLRQFNSDNVKIISNVKPSCEHLLMAKYKNINLNGNVTQCEHLTIDLEKECYSDSKYKCPKGDELVRHTTWITGDPHLYSYKNKYELCSTGQDAVCFENGDFKLLCSDAHGGGLNQLATVITSLKFIYKLNDLVNVTFEANETSFPSLFDNGQTIITKNGIDNHNSNNALVKLINAADGSKVIYIPNANAHIFMSRWNTFYSITLRATHQTYSESIGYLYDGCRLQDQLSQLRMKKHLMNKQELDCQTECSNIQFGNEDENMPKQVITNMCLFDCTEIGIGSTAMTKSMVENINTYLQSDNYTDLDFPNPTEETSQSNEYTLEYTVLPNEISTNNLIFSNSTTVLTSTFGKSTTKVSLTSILDNSEEPITELSIKSSTIVPTTTQSESDQQTSDNPIASTIGKSTTKVSLTSISDISGEPLTELSIKSSTIVPTSTQSVSDQQTNDIKITSTIGKSTATYVSTTKQQLESTTSEASNNKQVLSLKEYIAIGFAGVILILILIIFLVLYKIKKKIRVSNKD